MQGAESTEQEAKTSSPSIPGGHSETRRRRLWTHINHEHTDVDPKYNIFNLPPGVPLKYVRILNKHIGPSEDFLYIIFKCKNDCKTIFTPKNLIEMDRFTAKIT